jgi:Protein of unknown function (DUF3142)
MWKLSAALLLMSTTLHGAPPTPPPSLMLWAWERPGDLRHLPSNAGVAFLASSIYLDNGRAHAVPRFQPLRLSPAVYRMAIIRIESPAPQRTLSASQRDRAIAIALDTVRLTHPDALQIDFDAAASQRTFYSRLLRDLRNRLPRTMWLSITALVSWCEARSWLNGLPVDEIVPMTFEMGSGSSIVETMYRFRGEFANPGCRGSIGIAAQDISVRPRVAGRTYIFSYQDWTPSIASRVLSQLK